MARVLKKRIVLVERKLGRERAHGQAIAMDRLIEIDPRQTESSYLDTLIHEALHLLDPRFSETLVTRYARTIAGLVRRAGFRRVLAPLLPAHAGASPAGSGRKRRRQPPRSRRAR